MLTFRIATSTPKLSPSAWNRVLKRFQKEAGELVVSGVKSVLGTTKVYQLNPDYARRKEEGLTRPRMKPYPGKDYGQPLILTGEMYEGVEAHLEGDDVVISVNESAGVAEDGSDYAEEWEEKAGYLGKGLDTVQDALGELLCLIIVEEMKL